jgi:hypothetical protein
MYSKIRTVFFCTVIVLVQGCVSSPKKVERPPSQPKSVEQPPAGIFRGLFAFGMFMPCGAGETLWLEGNVQQLYQGIPPGSIAHPKPMYLEFRGDVRARELFVREILVMRPPSTNDCK